MSRILRTFAAVLLFFALSCVSSIATAQRFPSNRQLAEQNVVLQMHKWKFGGGVVGNNRNGFETVEFGSAASGVVIDRDGTLVTNFHVAVRTLEITATFDGLASKGGATYRVPFIKGFDRGNDIAILQIDGSANFVTAQLGDSDRIEARDDVLAVGNPAGSGLNITEGAISRVEIDRKTGDPARLYHTAPTAGGSSGGSLYKNSKVIGIHHASFSRASEFGIAIPVNVVNDLVENSEDVDRVLLTGVFSRDPDYWKNKLHQFSAQTETVPARPRQGVNGVWEGTTTLYQDIDYVFLVKTRDDVDLDIRIFHGNRQIGHGGIREGGAEGVAITNDTTREVRVQVHSAMSQPIPFGISIFGIDW